MKSNRDCSGVSDRQVTIIFLTLAAFALAVVCIILRAIKIVYLNEN